MLNRRLSSNLLTANEDINFNLDDIHVPLALVERRQRDKRPGETRAEAGSQLYEPTGYEEKQRFEHQQFLERRQRDKRPGETRAEEGSQLHEPTGYEEKQRFEHQQFLDDILGKGEGKTKGRQIAIIGEPGAGKTTQLQKIADWILKERPDLPIWISLADLQGRELGDYLLETWLKQAIPPSRLSEQVREDFLAQLEQGRVWLLLDGVDEMATERATAGLPLQQIATQLKGWIASARVVLTCRVNVWEANLNALEAFETYRMLNFNYPTQVEAFIGKWFKHSDAANGEALRQELAKAEYQRLQDLVKNPLRLTLLCSTWQTSEGLPETQAALYKRFVGKIYQWKQNYFPTTEQQRQQLNHALGELAREGIDDAASPFRRRHQLVAKVKVLGDCDDDNSLFALALQLGWLNQVGVAAEDPDEKVYAFYHATFQEYFAALSLEDWDFFLPREHCDRPVRGKKRYRIFEPLWKQPILLWLGRTDVSTESKEEFISRKEEFISRLIKFKDGCGNFYEYRAYFIAAAGIAEFKECDQTDKIVAQIVRWGFGYFDQATQNWMAYYYPILKSSREVLPHTIPEQAIAELVKLINPGTELDIQKQVVQILGKIGRGNELAIMELDKLLKSPTDEETKWIAASILEKINPGNPQALSTLIQLIKTARNEEIPRHAAYSLGKIEPGNQQAIAALEELLRTARNHRDAWTQWQTADLLGTIDLGDDIDPGDNRDEWTQWQAADSLGKIDPDNEEAINALVDLLKTATSPQNRRVAAQSLEEMSTHNKAAISALINLVETPINEYTRKQVIESLGKIGFGNQEVIAVLDKLIKTARQDKDEWSQWQAADGLRKIDRHNKEAIAALTVLSEPAAKEYIRRLAAHSLGEIDPRNKTAIDTLVCLLTTAAEHYVQRLAAESLRKIDSGNKQAIEALVERIRTATNEDAQREAAEYLGAIDPGNKKAISTLVNLVETATKEYNRREAAYSLGKIDPGNKEAITTLVNLVETTRDEDTRRQAVTSLGTIGTGNQQAVTTLIQLIETATDEYTRSEGAESLHKIVTTNQNYAEVVYRLKHCLSDTVSTNNPYLFEICYSLIWHCAQNLPYPEFHLAWDEGEDEGEPENLAELPQRLYAKLEEMGLISSLQLICIDGSKFIDKDNPAAKIYNEMRRANCPKCADGTPKTMADLQSYWDELTLESEQIIVLVFYNSLTTPEQSGFSERFLQDLSRFDGAICVVTEARVSGLQTFSPNQGNWFAELVNWIKNDTF